MKRKSIKFSDSILGQMGWTEAEYDDFMYYHCNFLMANNIKVHPEILCKYSYYKQTHNDLEALKQEQAKGNKRVYANDDW